MNLNKFSLANGGHDRRSEGTCLMEAISIIMDEEFGDHPKCVATPIADFGIALNDMATSTKMRNKYLRPLIPCLINTAKLEIVTVKLRYPEPASYETTAQNERHNTKVRNFLEEKLVKAFGTTHICWPAKYAWGDEGPANPEYQRVWKTGVGILQETAAYARELLGPSHDARECCTPEFLAMLKPAQEPVQTAIKTDA